MHYFRSDRLGSRVAECCSRLIGQLVESLLRFRRGKGTRIGRDELRKRGDERLSVRV